MEPLTWEPRGGTPLLCCIDDRVAARPFLGTRRSGVAGQGVEQEDGFILDFGLFPASDLMAQVLLESSGSPSGNGSRSLSARELGGLWDVPILFLDSLTDQEVGDLMGAICRTPPSKLLHSGADLLLTNGFRGSFVGVLQGQGSLVGVLQGQGSLVGVLQSGGSLPGPRPRSDSDLGLAPATKRLKHLMVCEPLAAAADEYVGRDEVIKGDSQKVDDAVVPDHLWLRAFVLGYGVANHAARHWRALGRAGGAVGSLGDSAPPWGWREALPGLRLFALRYWRSRVTRGYVTWRRANVPLPAGKQLVQYRWESIGGRALPVYEWMATGRRRYRWEWKAKRASTDGRATVEAGYDAIHRCADATWFEWPKGSALLFWNWGPEYQREARDGQPHFMTGPVGAPFMRKQSKARDPQKHELMRAKVVQVQQRGYIKPGKVVSGTHYFCVDKGTSDIRMVYNGTSCGLNTQLHAPHYGLLSVKHTLRALREGYYQCDQDVGEQFLNYNLHQLLRERSGVDVREV